MSLRLFSFIALSALSAVVLAAGPAAAQKGGSKGGGGGGHSSGSAGPSRGGPGPSSFSRSAPNPAWGSGKNNQMYRRDHDMDRRDRDDFRRRFYGFYGWDYYPWFFGLSGYGWYGNNYLGYGGLPIDYAAMYEPPALPSQPAAEAAPPEVDPNAVLLLVRVPAQAQVWIENTLMKQTGPVRLFESPVLDPGGDYQYEVRASWTENGKEVSRSRRVTVRSGDRLMLNFASPNRPEGPQPPAP